MHQTHTAILASRERSCDVLKYCYWCCEWL